MSYRTLFLVTLLLPWRCDAATYCVNSETALRSALDAAAASTINDEVRLVSGTYAMGHPVAHTVSGSLTISGGWNVGCALRTVAQHTTLLGKPQDDFILRTHARSLKLERVRWIGWNDVVVTDDIPGVPAPTARSGIFEVSRCAFSGMSENGLELFVGHHDATVENAVFNANAEEGLKIWRYGAVQDLVLVSNFNTLADNRAGVWMFDGSPVNVRTDVRILNTVSTRTLNANISLAYFNNVLIRNTLANPPALIYATLSPNSGNNLSGDPALDATLRPLAGSPLIDAGAFDPDFAPARDHVGNARWLGAAADIGAFEF
jgi:hypothetical protein